MRRLGRLRSRYHHRRWLHLRYQYLNCLCLNCLHPNYLHPNYLHRGRPLPNQHPRRSNQHPRRPTQHPRHPNQHPRHPNRYRCLPSPHHCRRRPHLHRYHPRLRPHRLQRHCHRRLRRRPHRLQRHCHPRLRRRPHRLQRRCHPHLRLRPRPRPLQHHCHPRLRRRPHRLHCRCRRHCHQPPHKPHWTALKPPPMSPCVSSPGSSSAPFLVQTASKVRRCSAQTLRVRQQPCRAYDVPRRRGGIDTIKDNYEQFDVMPDAAGVILSLHRCLPRYSTMLSRRLVRNCYSVHVPPCVKLASAKSPGVPHRSDHKSRVGSMSSAAFE